MSAPARLSLRLDPEPGNVDLARVALQGICAGCFGAGSEAGVELSLAVTEALNNAVEHARPRLITVEIARSDREVRVSVMNDGIPFDAARAISQLQDEGLQHREEGGYGLYLIRDLTDEFSYQYRDGCNVWVLSKRIPETGMV